MKIEDKTTITVSKATLKKLKLLAIEHDMNLHELIVVLIKSFEEN